MSDRRLDNTDSDVGQKDDLISAKIQGTEFMSQVSPYPRNVENSDSDDASSLASKLSDGEK